MKGGPKGYVAEAHKRNLIKREKKKKEEEEKDQSG